MSALAAAVRPGTDGCFIDLEVTPGAPAARFPDGVNPWRRRIRIRVRAPPQDGKANREVVRCVAERLGHPSDAVTLTSGETSTQKTVFVRGVRVEDVLRSLGEVST